LWEKPLEEFHFDNLKILKETLNKYCKKRPDISKNLHELEVLLKGNIKVEILPKP